MKSLYKRQLTMMVGVMVLSFTLLSTAFMLLSYRYIVTEKREGKEKGGGPAFVGGTGKRIRQIIRLRNKLSQLKIR